MEFKPDKRSSISSVQAYFTAAKKKPERDFVMISDIYDALRAGSVARQVFEYSDVPCGALARYGNLVKNAPFYYFDKNEVIRTDMTSNDGEVILPPAKWAPDNGEVQPDGDKQKIADKFVNYENRSLVSLCLTQHSSVIAMGKTAADCAPAFNESFRKIEQHGLHVPTIIVNKTLLPAIESMPPQGWDKATKAELKKDPLIWGHVYTADVFVIDDERLNDKAVFLGPKDIVGVVADVNAGVWYVKDGSLPSYDMGMMLINEAAICVVEFMNLTEV